MFGTVIIDAYSEEDKNEMGDAIEDLCSPIGSYGWASAGIYCFWNYYTKEVLYIGLASDLSDRFRQHNGIKLVSGSSCKFEKIKEYFKSNEKLGYTIFVQSPLSQPLTYRNKSMYKKFAEQKQSPVEDMLSVQGIDDIKLVEGLLIESYRRRHGKFPSWNEVGGSIIGQEKVMKYNYNIVKSFCYPEDYHKHPIIARSTIRELSDNATYEGFENYLHAVRMYILINGMDYMKALEFANTHDTFGWYKRIEEEGYNLKQLII